MSFSSPLCRCYSSTPPVGLYLSQGLNGSSFNTVVHSWGFHLKRPVFVAVFKPLSVAIVAVFGRSIPRDDLHSGSKIRIGFYAVICGKATEERIDEEAARSTGMEGSSDISTPFLQSPNVEDK